MGLQTLRPRVVMAKLSTATLPPKVSECCSIQAESGSSFVIAFVERQVDGVRCQAAVVQRTGCTSTTVSS